MTITAIRKIYSVTNTVDSLTLNGELSINANNGFSVSGMISNGDDSSNFYYSVDENSKINKNINNVSESTEILFNSLLDTTIAEIKSELTDKTIG